MMVKSWGGVKKSYSRMMNRIKGSEKEILVTGSRLSYGDSCLNTDGNLYCNNSNNLIINFDPKSAVITVEAGITFEELLNYLVPKGFFLPVTPGTKFITVGGAIANDIHGKNHHQDGNFGHWVEELILQRSDGDILTCTKAQNSEYFYATIGGLGLTGYIKTCSFKVIPIKSSRIDQETIKFYSLKEFLKINQESQSYKYTVAWVDCFSADREGHLKGLYLRGNHSEDGGLEVHSKSRWKVIPFNFPSWTLNIFTISIFNFAYFNKILKKVSRQKVHYESFFYPLDSVRDWNKIYGENGLFQFQCVIPHHYAEEGLLEILKTIKVSGQGSFLAVLKTFGNVESLGLMSFPTEGLTLALDFPNRKESTFRLIKKLYQLVLKHNGRIYPAKDMLLSKEMFDEMYNQSILRFEQVRDKNYQSDWWKRVRGID